MKSKLFTLLIGFFVGGSVFSQQPENPGFEYWENVGLTVPEPVDWSSIKTSQNSTLNGLAPYVWDQSTDAHSGNYSVRLYTVAGPFGITATGALTNGRVHSSINAADRYMYTDVNDPQWNTPLTERPDSLVIWAKFNPVGSDVAMARAILHTGFAKIPDAAQSNWIAEALIAIPVQTSTWTRFAAPFNYFNNNTPEYILIVLSSGGDSPNVGSEAFFDDVELIYNEPELDLTVFLEGAYAGGNQMSTALNPSYLTLQQPYNTSPWDYLGTESVASVPNNQVVDWVLVELRDAPSAPAATSATTVSRMAGFLLNDGSVVATDGSSMLTAPMIVNDNLYAVVWHRNHLAVMSSSALIKVDGVYTYNFGVPGSTYGTVAGRSMLEPGIPGLVGMSAGDGNADGLIDNTDKVSFWSIFTGQRGYLQSDYNMSGQVSNQDKNDYWLKNLNLGKVSQVP